MSRRLSLVAYALLGALIAASVAPAAIAQSASAKLEAPSTWHVTAYVRTPNGVRVIDYWSEGANMVARTLIGGHPITTLVRGSRYLVFDRLTGKGLDIKRSAKAVSEDRGRERPFGFELDEIKAGGGEKVEDMTIGSMRGEVWQLTNAQSRRKLWVSSGSPRVPLRLETFDRTSSETINLDYQGWIFDMNLPETFFSTPRGIAFDTMTYESFNERSVSGNILNLPILYPDLLHGSPSR